MTSESASRLSFVIPVRDDAQRLKRCLQSIERSDYPRKRLEVIVVDNGSSDGSAEMARESGARVFEVPHGSVSELRNRGAAAAVGEILAFADADHALQPGWTAAAVETLQDHSIGAVGAPYMAPPEGTWVQSAYDAFRTRKSGVHDVPWLGSGNLALRREVFERLGGFDAALATCEDVDLCIRLKRAGYRVVSDDRLRSVHYGDPATLRQLFAGELWRGRNNLRVSLRQPLPMRDLPSIVMPVLDLACIASLAAGILSCHRRGLWLAALSTAVVLVSAGARTVRMLVASALRPRPCVVSFFAVALTYDLARALALVARRRHHRP